MTAQVQFVRLPNFKGGANYVLRILLCICSVAYTASTACSKNWYRGFVGNNFVFHCNITNVSKAGWRRNTTNLLVREIDLIRTDNVHVLVGNYSLFVDSICLDDEGFYECIQDNKVVSTYCLQVMCK